MQPRCYCFTRLQRWPLTTARRTRCGDATWMRDATAAANTNSVVVLSTYVLLDIVPFFCGVTWSVSGGLRQATFRGKFEREGEGQRRVEGGGLLFLLKQWELRGDMQRCAHEWQSSGVCGSVALGLRPKAPFPAPHNEPAQGRDS